MSNRDSAFFESLEPRSLLSASVLNVHPLPHVKTAGHTGTSHFARSASKAATDKETNDAETSSGTDTDTKVPDPEEAGTEGKDIVDGPRDKAGKSIVKSSASSVFSTSPISSATKNKRATKAKVTTATDPAGGPDGENVAGGPGGTDGELIPQPSRSPP